MIERNKDRQDFWNGVDREATKAKPVPASLNPDQINRRLAEAMGWELVHNGYFPKGEGLITGYVASDEGNDYTVWTPYTSLDQASMVADHLGLWWKLDRLTKDSCNAEVIWIGKPTCHGHDFKPASALSLAIVEFLEEKDKYNFPLGGVVKDTPYSPR